MKCFIPLPTLVFLLNCSGEEKKSVTNDSFIRGMDISSLSQIKDNGGLFYDGGTAQDCIQILKNHGINYIRLRLWHNPTNGYCNKT